ncbi:MAG: sodium:proton antiporter [Actinomycetota bacterium]|nr:sodium:proton antiporter [Actinomycetota bacterium]
MPNEPHPERRLPVNRKSRLVVFYVGAAGLALIYLWGCIGLPDFGHYEGSYGMILNEVAVAERKATNVVAAVTFDYRGFDTLGEEFILFAAVIGTALLLRTQRDELEREPSDEARGRHAPHESDAVREVGAALVAPAVLFGLYIVVHGHLTPGGGFQGGVVLATAPLLMYLIGEYRSFRRLAPEDLVETAEGSGAGGYVVVGIIGLLAGARFLDNVFPLGKPGDLVSAGMTPLLNLSVGLAVSAGLVLLLSEFLEQTLMVRRSNE